MTIADVEKMWDEFADIPIDNDDEIEQGFYCWEKGTYRFEIWRCFNEELPNGIAEYTI